MIVPEKSVIAINIDTPAHSSLARPFTKSLHLTGSGDISMLNLFCWRVEQ